MNAHKKKQRDTKNRREKNGITVFKKKKEHLNEGKSNCV